MRRRWHSTCPSKGGLCNWSGYAAQRRQRAPDRQLADGEVLVVRTLTLLVRRDARAETEPKLDEIEERSTLVGVERMRLVIAPQQVGRDREWTRLIENGVGDGHCRIGDRPAVHHVAEVDQPANLLIPRKQVGPSAGEHVVIIRIVVNDGTAE